MLTAAPFDRHMPINRGMTYEQMLDAVETPASPRHRSHA